MTSIIARFARDEAGATSIEYALIAMFISIAILVGVQGIGTNVNSSFTLVNNAFSH